MTAALSELSVTEFVALARIGYLPRGLVVGACVYSAGTQYDWVVATREVEALSGAMREVRKRAVSRMRKQAAKMGADGVVEVRLEVEHQVWRNARQVARCVAVGTAVVFDRKRAPPSLRDAPSLRLSNGAPFDSDLSGADFVTLLECGLSAHHGGDGQLRLWSRSARPPAISRPRRRDLRVHPGVLRRTRDRHGTAPARSVRRVARREPGCTDWNRRNDSARVDVRRAERLWSTHRGVHGPRHCHCAPPFRRPASEHRNAQAARGRPARSLAIAKAGRPAGGDTLAEMLCEGMSVRSNGGLGVSVMATLLIVAAVAGDARADPPKDPTSASATTVTPTSRPDATPAASAPDSPASPATLDLSGPWLGTYALTLVQRGTGVTGTYAAAPGATGVVTPGAVTGTVSGVSTAS